MAAAPVSAKANEKECSQCGDLFAEPKLLPCGHLLCKKYLKSLADSKEKNVTCPDCHQKQKIKCFPTDIGMKNLVEAERTLTKGLAMCVCKKASAGAICSTCRQVLCEACATAHQSLPLSKDHILETLTAETLAASKFDICANHADKPAEVFCNIHKETICQTCAVGFDHRECRGVFPLETLMKTEQAELIELTGTLSGGEAEMDQAINHLNNQLQESNELLKTISDDALNFCDRFQDEPAKQCRQRVVDLTQKLPSENQDSVDKVKEGLQNQRDTLTRHKQALARAGGIQEFSELRQMVCALKARVDDIMNPFTFCPADRKVYLKDLVFDREVNNVEQLLQSIDGGPFSFHSQHGDSVAVGGDGHVAEKWGRVSHSGLVFSRQPLIINYLYEVKVSSLPDDLGAEYVLFLPGALACSPGTLSMPVRPSAWGWDLAVLLGRGETSDRGTKIPSSFHEQLTGLKKGDRVGVSLDENRNLRIHRDGTCLGIVTSSPLPQPAHALFAFSYPREFAVEALPMRYLKRTA